MSRCCPLLIFVFGFCATNTADNNASEALAALVVMRSGSTADAGPSGANLGQVQFDGMPLVANAPVIRCDADNSASAGVVVDLSALFAASYVKIEIVPSTSPYTFTAGEAFDLHLTSVHRPDGSAACTLTRTANTANRYTAFMSTNCGIVGHVLNRFEVDCKPD